MTEFGAAASSSSFTYRWPYHVFLSFRGEDTRQGFTGHLYNALDKRGIRTFIDDQGIRKGEEITPTLLKTIEESKTAIVVFSKDYASSTFCLRELVHILDCMKGHNDRFIWPVFYDVDPSNIRHQRGSYKVAFDQYEGVKDETTVKRWRSALTEAASMSGWPFDPRSKSYEYEIIEKIIEAVSKEISIGPLHVAQFPVGLESRVEEVCSLLNKQPHHDGATMLGIIGLGGIGKTTIARALYNEIAGNFKHLCFLNNVKEKLIHELQKKLLSETVRDKDIELEDYRRGIPIIRDRLHNKNVLLVLDDIDTLEQLKALAGEPNWFGSGSIIIITTRDKNLLDKHEVERIYEAKELNDEEAHDLLIGNAFRKEAADLKYEEVIIRAIKYAGGLPLVLEILGSNLGAGQTVKEWKTYLDIYEKIPNKTVQNILKVSYDGLEEMHKEVFLDIACFYRGYSLGKATNILSANYNIDSESCIRVLKDKSLIKIDHWGYLDMHDLIQDMGKEIVRQESPFEAGERSRLWSVEDILHVLNENTGTGKVQGMVNRFDYEEVEWSGEAFEKMKNLRVLSFSYCEDFSYYLSSMLDSFSSSKKVYQGPKCLPNSLKVVEWDNYPSSTLLDDFCPINLVILRLRGSHLKTLRQAFKNFYNLRTLDLMSSENLEEVPDISGVVNLEELNVSWCQNLTKIDDSVGHLVKLRVLDASRCDKLDTFIVGGIKLISLEILDVSKCSNLHTFPEILVRMEKIKTLDLSYTVIKTLPESIEKLVALERLQLGNSKYFGQLDLKTFYLGGCKQLQEIRKIPPNLDVFSAKNCETLTSSSIRALGKQKFYNLHKLDLSCSEFLEAVPDISGAVSLEKLNVSFCSRLIEIDDSVGHLAKLKVLNAQECIMLDTFIVGGIKLVSLEILNLRCCCSLHTFPEVLATAEKIKTIDLSHTAIIALPESFEKLVAVERLCGSSTRDFRLVDLMTLYLGGCKQLQEFRKIPPNIEVFSIENCKLLTSNSIRALLKQNFYNLHKLELDSNEFLEELPDISGATSLEELNVSYCEKLTKIDDSVGHLAKLRVLNVEGCKRLDTFIVGGIKLISLEVLNIIYCSKLHTFPEILVTMEKIKTLNLSYTVIETLPESIEKLVALEALYLSGCAELRQLPNLACLNLKRVNLDWCKELEEIRGIPPNIEVFFARSCTSLTSRTRRQLLTQELHDNGNTQFILPGKEIPKWFHKHSTEGSVSFWVRKKFPQIALCAVLKNGPLIASSIKILINGTHGFDVRDVILPRTKIEIAIDHIILFDLRKQGKDFKIGGDVLEKELNHVLVSWHGMGIGPSYQFVECIGVYVYNYDSCMEDIVFENPSPQRGTPEEVVHRICDSDLESLSVCYDDRGDFRDWIQEGKAKGKGIIVHGGDAIEEKDKNAFEVTCRNTLHSSNNESLTLDPIIGQYGSTRQKDQSTIIDEGHDGCDPMEWEYQFTHPKDESIIIGKDLQQQQQLTSINQQISERSEIVKEAKKKDIMVHGGNANEIKDKNAFEVTCQNGLRSSNNESFTLDPMVGQYRSTRQKDQSTIIDEGHDGCDPMEWEYQFTPLKDQSTIIDEGHDGCHPMEWEYQFTHPKDQSTIIGKDDKSKNQIVGSSTEVVSSARKKEINLKVDAVDGLSFSTTSEITRDLLLSDLQQQQHLSYINQKVSENSENVKKAKGKNIIVPGDNANEEKDSNILEKDQSAINDKGHDETESHKARVTCFDLFSYLVSLCSSSASS